MKIKRYIKNLSFIMLSCFACGSEAIASPYTNSPTYDLSQYHNYIDSSGKTHTVGSILSSDSIDKANGIAGLDANGNITNPIESSGVMKTGLIPSSAYNGGNTIIPSNYLVSIGDNNGFNILDNRSTLIGSRRYAGGSPTFINALPYGGSALGSVLSVGMTKSGIGGFQTAMAPSGTDGGGGISNYPEMDAADTWFAADTSYPWVTVGADYTSSDGQAHTVTYDSTHAYFTPALSSNDVSLLRNGMHVMTNSIGSTRVNDTNRWQPNNDYAGEITNFATDGTSITVGGWRVLGAGNGDTSQVPGNNFDTKMWPTYKHSALFIGVYTHEIVNNSMCFLENRIIQTKGDYNGPEVNTYPNPANDCEIEEADLGSRLPDYMGKAKGILVTYNGPNKPTIDSYDFFAAGEMPFGYLAWNGSLNVNFLSDGFMVRGNNGVNGGIGSNGDIIAKTTDTHQMAEFIGTSAVQPNGTGSGDKMSLSIWEQTLTDSTNMGGNPGSNTSIHLGQLINGTTTDISKTTADEKVDLTKRTGEIVYNVDGTGGIAMHGGTSGLGAKVDSQGSLHADKDIYVGTSSHIFFPTSNNGIGSYFNVDDLGNIVLGTQVEGGGGLDIPGSLIANGIQGTGSGPSSSVAGFTQGWSIGWNTMNVGMGETDFINSHGAGTGGFAFYNTDPTTWNSATKPDPIALIDASGNLALKSKGAQLSFAPLNGDTLTPFIYATDGVHISATNAEGDGVVLSMFGFDGQEVVATTSLQAPFSTPSSSSATCTTGQIEDDANYHYVCVATNTWKRVALSSF